MATSVIHSPSTGRRRRRTIVITCVIGAAALALILALVFMVGGKRGGNSISKEKSGSSVATDAEKGAAVTPDVSKNNVGTGETQISTGGGAGGGAGGQNKPGGATVSGATDGAEVPAQGDKESVAGCSCNDEDTLRELIAGTECPVVTVTDYVMIMEQVKVARTVTVMGSPTTLPLIDASMTVRAFQVVDGGFLELKFVRVQQGMGEIKPRLGFPKERRTQGAMAGMDHGNMGGMDVGNSKGGMSGGEMGGMDMPDMSTVTNSVMVMRGAGVAVEKGALGAAFVGVVFLMQMNTMDSVKLAITETFNNVGMRMYGGHVFVAAGTVTFSACHFWDTVLLMPLNDQIMIGGDVLVVAGEATFTACTFTQTVAFGSMGGVGMQVAVLGGVAMFTFCTIQQQSIAMNMMGAGTTLFVGAGVMVLTGFDFRMVAAVMSWFGIGNFFVGAGVLVQTGMTIENAWGAMSMVGAGYYMAAGAGVHVQTGVTYVQFQGPNFMAMTGGLYFLGTGASINTGVSATLASATMFMAGQAMIGYNGAGYAQYIGCPTSMTAALMAFTGLGMMYSQPAGLVVFIGNPTFMATALMFFAGLGSMMFVGGGSAVLGYNPMYMAAARYYMTNEMMYWINGNDMATGCGPVVYVNKTGIYGHWEDSDLLSYIQDQKWDDSMDPSPHTPIDLSFGNGQDFHEYKLLKPREPTSLEDGTYEGIGSALWDHIADLKWKDSYDSHGGEIDLDFGDGGFDDYKSIGRGMAMGCSQMGDGSMDMMTMAENGIVMKGWHPNMMSHMMMMGSDMHSDMMMGITYTNTDKEDHHRQLADTAQQQQEVWLNPFEEYLGPEGGLLARDIQVYRNVDVNDSKTFASIKDWADPTAIGAASKLRESLGLESYGDSPVMFVGDQANKTCSTCNVDAMGGGGNCKSAESCSDLGDDEMFSWDGVKFKPTLIQLTSLQLMTPDNSSALLTSDVASAVKSLLAQKGLGGVKVTVFPTSTGIPSLEQFVAEPSVFTLSDNSVLRSYKAVFVSDDDAEMRKVTAVLQGDGNGDTFANNVASLLSTAGVGSAALSLEKSFNIPAYNSKGLASQLGASTSSSAGSNSVRIVEHGNNIPVTTITAGKTYDVLLENFPPGSILKTVMVGSKEASDKKVQTTALLSLASLVDSNGSATIMWKVPADSPLGDDYHIQASDLSGKVSGMSSLLSVTNQRRRRKLYGPLMYM